MELHDKSALEIRQAAARAIAFGLDGTTISDHARRLIAEGVGGMILFARNFQSPDQISQLCFQLKQLAFPRPLIVMVDQEGGKVQRFGPPFTVIPTARAIGLTNEPECAGVVGSVIGRELKAVFVDLNLAPIADVDTNPKNPVIGNRSYASSPTVVSDMATAFVKGIQTQRIGACAKHFPGHGDTSIDSHSDLPHLKFGMKRLLTVELLPFKYLIQAGVASIMMSHIVCDGLIPMGDEPATVSRGLPSSMRPEAVKYLREDLKFDGLILSDCMEMGAIAKYHSPEESSVAAINAGVDLLLFCQSEENQVRAINGLADAINNGSIRHERLMEAHKMLDEFCEKYVYIPPNKLSKPEGGLQKSQLDVIGCKEHQDLLANVLHMVAMAGGSYSL